MKKTDDRRYFVVNVKENDETVLFEYDDEDSAKAKMTILGKKQKPGRGIIGVVRGRLSENGDIDYRERTDIAAYDRWLERIMMK